MHAVFSCVQAVVWLPMSWIFIVHTDVEMPSVVHCGSVSIEREHALKVDGWENNFWQHGEIEPASALCGPGAKPVTAG